MDAHGCCAVSQRLRRTLPGVCPAILDEPTAQREKRNRRRF
jgi:hypothetical protein